MSRFVGRTLILLGTLPLLAGTPDSLAADREALSNQAKQIFGTLPEEARSKTNRVTREKIRLGRTLYYDPRLSKNQDVSCNSCHVLDAFGVDGEATSPGHRQQRGSRNSPTVYNAAIHVSQFWDGRAADVEEQAKGPVLNPVEMAMPSEQAVVDVLDSIPGYAKMFESAFPKSDPAISFDNMALAIGAFERRLFTPSRFDRFQEGQLDALNAEEVRGLSLFIQTGCVTCHNGPALGGSMYQKIGLVNAYETSDAGRFEVTGLESDRFLFKVPSLRNVARTGPWFHDGSVRELREAVRRMGWHQLGVELDDDQQSALVAFLGCLTGEIDHDYVQAPALPPSGPETPAPDPH